MASEQIEGVIEHITYTKGVLGVVVCTTEGEPIRDSFQNLDRSLAQAYATLAADLARQAAGLFAPVKTWAVAAGASAEGGKGASRKKSNVSPPPLPISESTVEMIRVRTLLHEIIVRCSEEFILVVVQEPVD